MKSIYIFSILTQKRKCCAMCITKTTTHETKFFAIGQGDLIQVENMSIAKIQKNSNQLCKKHYHEVNYLKKA